MKHNQLLLFALSLVSPALFGADQERIIYGVPVEQGPTNVYYDKERQIFCMDLGAIYNGKDINRAVDLYERSSGAGNDQKRREVYLYDLTSLPQNLCYLMQVITTMRYSDPRFAEQAFIKLFPKEDDKNNKVLQAYALSMIAQGYKDKGNEDKEFALYHEALSLCPENIVDMYNIARIYGKQGSYKACVYWAERAKALGGYLFTNHDELTLKNCYKNVAVQDYLSMPIQKRIEVEPFIQSLGGHDNYLENEVIGLKEAYAKIIENDKADLYNPSNPSVLGQEDL